MATPVMGRAEQTSAASPYITVTFRIRRFNPQVSAEAIWQDFAVEIDPKERVLDGLHRIKWEQDGSLTFRRSCAHGICGSDAMRINGRNRLACKTLIKDIHPEEPVTVEPIKGLTVLKDLVVDMEPFFRGYRDVMPFLMTTGNEPTREPIQSAADRERFDDTTKCILCAACTSSCPVFWTDGQYFGPAAIVNAHRTANAKTDPSALAVVVGLLDRSTGRGRSATGRGHWTTSRVYPAADDRSRTPSASRPEAPECAPAAGAGR